MSQDIPELFATDHLVARRQVFKLLGAAFHVYSTDQRLLGYSKQKAFKFKEDIRVFADEEMTHELLKILARSVIDFSASYDVYDSHSNEHVGTLRRKGWSSLFRDQWEILDSEGTLRGRVMEDSGWKAFLRRLNELVSFFLPQVFHIEVDGVVVGIMKQNMALFAHKYEVDLSHDTEGLLPRPLAVATVILLLAIEGRQG